MKPAKTRLGIGSGGVLYLIVASMILASAIYTQANLLFWGFGLTVGGLLASIVAAALALRGLEVVRVVPEHGASGEIADIRYRVNNRGWLPAFGVVIREVHNSSRRKRLTIDSTWRDILTGPPHAWLLHVGPRCSIQTAAPFRPQKRGRLVFDMIEVSTSFPFGVIHKTAFFKQQDKIDILPSVYRLRRQLLGGFTVEGIDSSRSLQRAGGNGDFFGVREYRPGDSPRNIDWKRTARTGELFSRERTLPNSRVLNIVLDLTDSSPIPAQSVRAKSKNGRQSSSGSRLLEERAISLTASLICDASLRGIKVGLRVLGFPQIQFSPQNGLLHRIQLLEALTGIDLDKVSEDKPRSDLKRIADLVVSTGSGCSAPLRFGGVDRGVLFVGAEDFEDYILAPTELRDFRPVDDRLLLQKHIDSSSPNMPGGDVAEVG